MNLDFSRGDEKLTILSMVYVRGKSTGFDDESDTKERELSRIIMGLPFVQLDFLSYHLLSGGLLKESPENMKQEHTLRARAVRDEMTEL